ncbi:hypothetical protein [Sandarakinorhabdus sp. DWP1-3-1]|uniref:hypothetical protein n=1 Tax=Sandarakinorhabdus sp. DWP1-3-1 TaxID=2804627 RepID=UPI003CEEAE76
MREFLWGAVALMVAGAAPAAAQAAKPVDPMADDASALAPAGDAASRIAFAYADRDADLLVTWEEYRNRAMRLFGKVDANGDGILQVAELQALAGPKGPTPPGDVDLGTFNAGLRKHFDDGDAGKDGALTPAEWRNVVRPSKLF